MSQNSFMFVLQKEIIELLLVAGRATNSVMTNIYFILFVNMPLSRSVIYLSLISLIDCQFNHLHNSK